MAAKPAATYWIQQGWVLLLMKRKSVLLCLSEGAWSQLSLNCSRGNPNMPNTHKHTFFFRFSIDIMLISLSLILLAMIMVSWKSDSSNGMVFKWSSGESSVSYHLFNLSDCEGYYILTSDCIVSKGKFASTARYIRPQTAQIQYRCTMTATYTLASSAF